MKDLRELLTAGRLVIFSDGSKGIVVPHKYRKEAIEELAIAYDSKEYDYIVRWDKDLYDTGWTRSRHILKIYEVGSAYDFWREAVWNENERSLVWDRNLQVDKTKVMTLSEVEKALGHKVKIILDKPDTQSCSRESMAEGDTTHYYEWKKEYTMEFKPLPKAEPNPSHLIGEDEEEDYPFEANKPKEEPLWKKVTDWGPNATIYTKNNCIEYEKPKFNFDKFDF